jgi:pantoate--beta-alanine ligase
MEEGVKVEVEYFNLADSEDLETLETVVGEKGAILSAALRMLPSKEGERSVRIIDNIILK